MAETLGVTFEPVEVTWATPARAMAIDFPSQPLLYYALAVLADEDLEISAWEDLNKDGMKISVSKGTTMEAYITKHLPNAEILSFPDNAAALAAFQSGRMNAVCLFHPPLITMRKNVGKRCQACLSKFHGMSSSIRALGCPAAMASNVALR
jgi:polar amino acid transport system substrate-binding protein